MKKLTGTTLILILQASAHASSPDQIFTLYRTSPVGQERIHVATFDAAGEAPDYNHGNCEMVVRALSNEPGVPAGYYWCEPGKYRR